MAVRRRLAPFLLTLLIAAAIIASFGSRAVLAPSAADSELLAVHVALSDVKQQFFRPISTGEMLKPAWDPSQRSRVKAASLPMPSSRRASTAMTTR